MSLLMNVSNCGMSNEGNTYKHSNCMSVYFDYVRYLALHGYRNPRTFILLKYTRYTVF